MIITVEELLELFFAVLGMVITVFLVPCLKAMLKQHQRRELLESAETAITAVQQMFPQLDGELQRQYALDLLESQGFEVNTLETKMVIEAATLRLNSMLKQGRQVS